MKLAEAYFVSKYNVDQAKAALRVALMEPHTKDRQVDVEGEKMVIQCLEKVHICVDACSYSSI